MKIIKKLSMSLVMMALILTLMSESCELDVPTLKIYPNPASEVLNVELSDEIIGFLKSEGEPIPQFTKFEIFSLQTGKKIKDIHNPSKTIDVSFLEPGPYTIMVWSYDELIGSSKFLINR